MTGNDCPQCGKSYEACDCPATKGSAAEPITPEIKRRAHLKAAMTLILAGGRPMIPEPDTDERGEWFPERKFSTGNMGRISQNQDSYTVGWTATELQAYNDRRRRQRKMLQAMYEKERERAGGKSTPP